MPDRACPVLPAGLGTGLWVMGAPQRRLAEYSKSAPAAPFSSATFACPPPDVARVPVYWCCVLELTIRPATVADAAKLAGLHKGIYDEGRWFVGDGPPSTETLRGRLRLLEPSRSLYLVAAQEDGLAGWLELHRLPPKKMHHVAVLTLAVARPYRQRGVAGRLLGQAYGWAQGVGVKKLQLNVRAHNRAALALYEREGFGLEGRERAQVCDAGVFEDNLLMAKFL